MTPRHERPEIALGESRVTCPSCALRDNVVVECVLSGGPLTITAACPRCGYTETVRPK